MTVTLEKPTRNSASRSQNMILLSNHLLTLPAFETIEDVTIRINLAHVKDVGELEVFLQRDNNIFLDYPKGRTKPPLPTLTCAEAIDVVRQHHNIKYFATTIEDVAEALFICNLLPLHTQLVPKIETLKGVLNLGRILATGHVGCIMLDSEDLYTDAQNDVELFLSLKERVKRLCDDYGVKLLQLYGVVFA